MSAMARHRAHPPRRHRVIKTVCVSLALVLVVVLTGGFLVYRHLEGNITGLDVSKVLGSNRPASYTPPGKDHKPLNILLLGSDTRAGQSGHIGGETPGLSDTTILLHISADRTRSYGVSLPRDAMVQRPSCPRKDGNGIDPGGLTMFNAAYAVGGPGCTQKMVEQLTGVRIDHFLVIDFNGFKTMVDALGGVKVCVPQAVHDNIGHIDLKAGTYDVTGANALDYVRVRHAISANGDIGRMKRQQAFLASMANKAISAGTLVNPVRLYNFLDAATKSLTTDPSLAHLKSLASIAKQLKNIGLSDIQFLTVPFDTYQPDPNRLVWDSSAKKLWRRMKLDKPLTPEQTKSVTTAADNPSKSPSSGPSGNESSSASPSQQAAAAAAAEQARENGLCA
jgi:LCP family protein required for cell wall assembly